MCIRDRYRPILLTIVTPILEKYILEKCQKFNLEMHFAFNECEKMFDTLIVPVLWDTKNKRGYPKN